MGRSLSIRQEIGDNDGVTWCLEKLAELAFQNGDLEKSARILGGAARVRREVNSPINTADKPNYDALLSALHDRLGAETFETAWNAGTRLPSIEAIQNELNA